MPSPNEFIKAARERGFIHQITDEPGLNAALAAGQVSAYLGFDLTADSLHVGHLLPIMLLRLFRNCGHEPSVVFGGATSMVGDPSGRDAGRSMLTPEQIGQNWVGIQRSIDALLGPVRSHRNEAWLNGFSHISFLREVGAHFSVNRMLTMDSVRTRLERDQPLSYLEFGYMLLQSYDFVALNRSHGITLQVGGSDQWGNIVMGVDLVRRMNGAQAFGMTVPLLKTASGKKMGKTADGAVWLHPDRLSPYGYWQFWRNTDDGDVGRFLAMFTELPMAEVRRLEALGGAELNEAKKILATEATALLHGRPAADEAAAVSRATFETGDAAEGLPSITLDLSGAGTPLAVALVRAGLARSNSDGRRLIEQGGVQVNGAVETSATAALTEASLAAGAVHLTVGKRRHALVRAEMAPA